MPAWLSSGPVMVIMGLISLTLLVGILGQIYVWVGLLLEYHRYKHLNPMQVTWLEMVKEEAYYQRDYGFLIRRKVPFYEIDRLYGRPKYLQEAQRSPRLVSTKQQLSETSCESQPSPPRPAPFANDTTEPWLLDDVLYMKHFREEMLRLFRLLDSLASSTDAHCADVQYREYDKLVERAEEIAQRTLRKNDLFRITAKSYVDGALEPQTRQTRRLTISQISVLQRSQMLKAADEILREQNRVIKTLTQWGRLPWFVQVFFGKVAEALV